MVTSMTGFGRGTAQANGLSVRVEIRSVNKRHHDVSLRLPPASAEVEAKIQSALREAFERGRFTVALEADREEAPAASVALNTDAARHVHALLERLRSVAQVTEPVRLEHLLQFEALFASGEESGELTMEDWPAIQGALSEAMNALQAMRDEEGRALRADLNARIDAIDTHLEAVQARIPDRVAEHQAKLRERLAALLDDDRLDPDRLETEIAILADKLDLNEECVRLRSHLTQFREACADDQPTGRRLKFITQEIHREVNTIGAKANDSAVSGRAVQMKEEVEKIREQVENVE
jgi:uncharacterized protein (TIGR00255 family)